MARSRRTEWSGELPPPLRDPRFEKVWRYWLDYRREEKLELVTQRAGDMKLKNLADMGVSRAIRAIEYSIEREWLGIFEEDQGPRERGSGGGGGARAFDDDLDRLVAKVARGEGQRGLYA